MTTAPNPNPAPNPAPNPSPAPAPNPPPNPNPAPNPQPTLLNPSPNPAPSPSPSPAPNPEPSPNPAPNPEPSPNPAAVPEWPTDWRQRFAGDDAKLLERLSRMQSPLDIFKSYRALEAKLSSGEFKAVAAFPDKGTDAEKAAWRQQNGVPETPEGYKIELADGMVIGEADKPLVSEFTKAMHAQNASGAEVNRALNIYYKIQDEQGQQIATEDGTYRQTTEETLRHPDAWGQNFKRNVTIVDNYLGSLPDGLGAQLAGGRLADGRRIGDDPRFMNTMLKMALEANPAATLVPNQGGDPSKAIEAEIAEMNKWMAAPEGSDDWKKYWKDDKAQERYRKLLDARDAGKKVA